MEQDLEKSIDAKIEEALETLFNNDDDLKSKVQDAVKSLLYYENFTYKHGSTIVGNLTVYAQINHLIKSMDETSAFHNP